MNISEFLNTIIIESATNKKYISLHEIEDAYKSDFNVAHSTIKTYLSRFVSNTSLFSAGKGWYSNLPNPFKLETTQVQELIKTTEAAFPLLSFQVWSTAQVNSFTQHLLSKHLSFVSTDSEAMQPVAEELRKKGYTVFVNPGKPDIEKHFRIDEKTIVVRPSISKEPAGENHAAPIEKILVDLIWESAHLKFIDETEAQEIANNATAAGRIQMATLLGYAKRRLVDFSWLKTINQVQKNEKFGDS